MQKNFISRLLYVVSFPGIILWSHALEARDISRDEVFIVASKNLLSGGVSFIGTPSVNETGDVVARITTGAGTEHRVFLFSAQTNSPPAGNTPSIIARSSANTLGSLPLINNYKSVVSSLSFTMGNQNILRLDFDSGTSTYSSTPIARGNVTQTQPFSLLSPIAAIDDATPANVYFYGERTPSLQPQNRRIYSSSDEVTNPASRIPIASYSNVFSALELYVAASPNSNVVYRGTKSGELGIYKGTNNLAVATPALGFSTTGTRPNINSLGTVSFYGVYDNIAPQLPGVFLWLEGEPSPRLAGNLATRVSTTNILIPSGIVPTAFSSGDRIALNDFNQVAFLGNDSDGNQTIFTTALGRTRKLVSVGDRIRSPINNGWVSMTTLFLYHGLGKKGQATFLANTSDGDQLMLVANRAYNQRSTLYSPIIPSYRGTQYLLRSVTGSGFPPTPTNTIGYVGCNLISTVNLLNVWGANTSPLEFQNWLIANRARFINRENDLMEPAVEAFSQYLISQHKATDVVRFRNWHNTNSGSNLDKIKSELRAGRPVKLRVPSSERYGHYILAYGIIDPSKPDAQITAADILIADPGKNPDFTLADYGQIISPQHPGQTYDQVWGANWIENQGSSDSQRRVHLYDTTPTPNLAIGGHSPIHLILTDALGRRTGFSSATGTLREIPGSDYYEEISYQNSDESGEIPEPAWGTTDPVKHIMVNNAVTGTFTLNIIGTGTGSYTISLLGNGGISPDISSLSGNINLGDTRTVSFNLEKIKPKFLDPLILPNGSVTWTVVGSAPNPIVLETSTNLVNWTTWPGSPITNGIGTITLSPNNAFASQFLRANQAN